MYSLLTSVIGYSATVIGTLLMAPQVYKSYRTKSADDISWFMLVLYFLNCSLWLAYGALLHLIPLILTNTIALFISTLQIILKAKYSRR